MTKRKPAHLKQKVGRKPLPPEQMKRWTLIEIRDRCRVTLTDCWEWKFSGPVKDHVRRFKQVKHAGKPETVRQVAYMLMYGKRPPEGFKLSPAKCLNPYCNNPMHCRPVTESEKCLIGSRRGTFATPKRAAAIARAKQAANGKLPEGMETARRIRATTGPATVHAPKYGISVSLFNRIRRGEAWKEAHA